jgi:hypothetical protein
MFSTFFGRMLPSADLGLSCSREKGLLGAGFIWGHGKGAPNILSRNKDEQKQFTKCNAHESFNSTASSLIAPLG